MPVKTHIFFLFRLYLQPVVPVNDDTVGLEDVDTAVQDLGDHVQVAVGLPQLGGRDPDDGLGGDGPAGAVQHRLGIVIILQAGQGQPQLHMLHHHITNWVRLVSHGYSYSCES